MDFRSEDYGLYLEHDFRHRWLRPDILFQKLDKYCGRKSLLFEEIGNSVEGRPIHSIQWGSGPMKLLLWSQIHGNEPTATMAMVDLLNFLSADDGYNEMRERLTEKLKITFVPMLNPDGSERFTRLNALGVDLNRDALVQRMPEMRHFWKLVEKLQPDWAFNLHDQRSIFSAGDTGYPATMSFLAPSADLTKQMTPAREKSMKLIGFLADVVQEHLPHHVGRYTDEFYPRALGDNLHGRGIPCVLIESGAFPEDEFRDQARKLNFLCILKAFNSISSGDYKTSSIDRYHQIPENATNFYDLIIRGCELPRGGEKYKVDIGLMYQESVGTANSDLVKNLIVKEIGDLQYKFGLREEEGGLIDASKDLPAFEQAANFRVLRERLPTLNFEKGFLYEERKSTYT